MTAEFRLIADRYRLERWLGSGAMGVVWQAVDERLGRPVAVKQLLLQPGLSAAASDEAQARSMREGRIAARLQHPHAVGVFDVAIEDDRPWLIMEYVPSRSLASVLAEQGPLPPQEVARIGRQVADALAAAHEAGIVHRDVKPGNVLLGDNGTVKITDFGISRASWDVTVTRTGVLAGTPAYFAPEVARGREPSPASDVFSLGATLYAAVEGQPPFGTDDNTLALLHRVAEAKVQPPMQAGVLTASLMQMLRADPEQRPRMNEVKQRLGSVAAGGAAGVAGPPPQRTAAAGTGNHQPTRTDTPAPKPAPAAAGPSGRAGETPWWRRRAVLAALVLVLLVVVGLSVLVATSGDQQQAPATSTPAPSAAPPPNPAPPPAQLTPETIRSTVQTYYGLLPDDTETAFAYLGEPEREKSGSLSGYERFWNGIASIRIVSDISVDGNVASLTLRFERTDGSTSTERYQLIMAISPDGRIIIERSRTGGG